MGFNSAFKVLNNYTHIENAPKQSNVTKTLTSPQPDRSTICPHKADMTHLFLQQNTERKTKRKQISL